MIHTTTKSTAKAESKKIESKDILSLYNDPPEKELTLDEFELLSLDRLELLRSIEMINLKNLDDDEIHKVDQKYKEKKSYSKRFDLKTRDCIGHFILRLAYCRSEDLRRWFITQECALMKSRLSSKDLGDFMRSTGLEFEEVSEKEKSAKSQVLIDASNILIGKFPGKKYFKIPFQQALTLISQRKVYLENGFAFVPENDLTAIIVMRFRMNLSRALTEAANKFDFISSDSRIGPLLKNMNKQYIGNDYSGKASTDKLNPTMVDEAAHIHMPICMKNLHMSLKRDHKLKHMGRLQYGLFLKGAGLELEDALIFWETHFSKLVNHDQFVKNYSYSFRHMYGKEGARKNYTPYSCMKIIMGSPPETGTYHGCPYKHAGDNQLATILSSLSLSPNETKEITTLAKSGDYQLACAKHFEITHPGYLNMDLNRNGIVANHPNNWYETSVNYHKLKNGEKLEKPTERQFQASPETQESVGTPLGYSETQEVEDMAEFEAEAQKNSEMELTATA